MPAGVLGKPGQHRVRILFCFVTNASFGKQRASGRGTALPGVV